MLIKVNNVIVPEPDSSMLQGQSLVIGIDSSKSNTALTIGNTLGKELMVLEMSGYDEPDVFVLCKKQRKLLKQVLQGCVIKDVGIEDIITTESKGIEVHMSRFKITAVFMSLIIFFEDTYNIKVKLINNKSWKFSILPAEYNKKEVYKGSKLYFQKIHSPYGSYSDDGTDSICIYRYLVKTGNYKVFKSIPSQIDYRGEYVLSLLPEESINSSHMENIDLYRYNKELSFDVNIKTICSYMLQNEKILYSVLVVDTMDVSLDLIYKYVNGEFKKKQDKLAILIKLKEAE